MMFCSDSIRAISFSQTWLDEINVCIITYWIELVYWFTIIFSYCRQMEIVQRIYGNETSFSYQMINSQLLQHEVLKHKVLGFN